jgi:hypothetical protein
MSAPERATGLARGGAMTKRKNPAAVALGRKCVCCGRTRRDAKVRIVIRNGPPGNVLCQPCWDDPAARMDECAHGLAPGDDGR